MKNTIGVVVAIATIGSLGVMAYRRYMTKTLVAGPAQVVKGLTDLTHAKKDTVVHLGQEKG